MTKAVVDLDTSLTELQKVSDLTGSSLKSFVDDAYEVGTKVARTGKDVVDATTEFAKAGYSVEDSLNLAEDALLWKNISDGMVEVSDASSMIIANLKAFDKQGISSRHIIDSLNEVSNNFAVTSSDLSSALERSASVLANSGTSFEEYLGLVTAGTEITRNSDKVANGLKTISLRLQGMTDEGEEDLELMAKLGPELSKIGVAIQDSEGNLRSTYDILKDLSFAFEDLSEAEKAYYTELIAGKYQANVATSILANFESAINATETALNSNGSAIRENEKYMESIAGRLNQLSSEFQKLAYNTIDSGFIKGLIDIATNILRITNNAGGLIPVLTTIIGILMIIKRQKIDAVFTSIGASFSNFINSIKSGKGVIASLSSTFSSVSGVIGTVVAGVSIFISVLNSIKAAQEQARMEAEQSIESYQEEAATINSLKDEYLSIVDSTASASEKDKELAEFKKKLVEQYGYEKDAIDKVNQSRETGISLMESEIKASADKYIAENRGQYESARELIESGTWEHPIDFSATIPKIELAQDEIKSLADEFENLNVQYKNSNFSFSVEADNLYDKVEKLSDIISVLQTRLDTTGELTEAESKVLEYLGYSFDASSKVLEENSSIYEGYNQMLADSIKYSNEYSASLIDSKEEFESWSESILDAAGSNEAVRDILEEYIEEVGIAEGYIESFTESTDEANSSNSSFSTSISETTEQLSEMEDAYSTLSSAVEEYNENGSISAETLNELMALDSDYINLLELQNGKLVLNKQRLNEKAQELKNNALVSNAAALGAELHAIAMGTEKTEAEKTKTAVDSLGDAMESLKNSGITGLFGVTALTEGIAGLRNVMANDPMWNGFTKEQEEAMQDAINSAQKRVDLINSMTLFSGGSSSGSSKSSSSSSKSSEDPIKKQSEAFKEQIEILEHELFLLEQIDGTEQQRIELIRKIQKTTHEQADWFRAQGLDENSEYIRNLSEQWWGYEDEVESIYDEINNKNSEAFKERLKISEDYIEDRNFYGDWGADSEIKAWGRVLEWMKTEYFDKGLISWEEYSENVREVNKKLYTAIEEYAKETIDAQKDALETQKDNYEIAFSYMADQIQEEIDALKEKRDEEEKYWDDKIDALKEQNEEINKQIELEEAQEALERAKSQKTMRVYYEDKGWVWEANRDDVAEAEKNLEEIEREQKLEEEVDRLEKLKEEALANIDEQIEGWEKYKEEWSSVADDYKKEQDRLIAEQVLGIKLEGDNWKTRIDNLQDYVEQYKSLMSQISFWEGLGNYDSSSNSGSVDWSKAWWDVENNPNLSEEEKKNLQDWIHSQKENEMAGSGSTFNPDSGKWDTSSGSSGSSSDKNSGTDWSKVWNDAQKDYESGKISESEKNKIQDEAHKNKTEEMQGSGATFDPSTGKWSKSYSSGGIVDYTGYAMVHGNSERPEVVLNNSQATNLYNWIRNLSPKTKSVNKEVQKSGYDFTGAVFNITTSANSFESLIRDIKIKAQNR